ncbi:DUF4350 domain-containing protein [Streptosporangium saharense]|uniref:DUF4350 domain-containing protein n=1 Tax=Streptosporangium saharense TaxID=1706840 RepID=A0A7W7QIQ5_9ACTN|nr:DUF4350 domain-containing protein [Streptosporangium saharense]MBB4914335.1 hypothetical protein [Streptosporangium saharense]
MSSPTGLAPVNVPGTGESRPTSPTAGSLWRGGRGALLAALLVVLVAVGGVLLSGGQDPGRPLDPESTALTGSRGMAQLLRANGVRVVRVTSVTEAVTAAEGAQSAGGSTLLIGDTSFLDEEEVERLAAAPADRLVVGDQPYLTLLAPGVNPGPAVRTRSREPGCSLPAAVKAGSAYLGGTTFTTPFGGVGCYPANGSPSLISYADEGRTVTVVGDGQFMSNLRLAEDGNAALATNLAGARPTLVWLVAPETPSESGAAPQSVYDLIPPAVGWAVVQLGVVVVLLALWQGRRLGPVVTERLPVVVRAAETVEGRARLYRARRARDRAVSALRTGFVDRVIPRLGLPATATPDAVVGAIVERTGQPAAYVGSALYGQAPADEAGLIAVAAYLDMLERQVRES